MMMSNSPASEDTDRIDLYPVGDNPATPSCLDSYLKQQILTQGLLSFDHWMELCLYHPEWGYYTNGNDRVGKTGDFFTSVSVGKCFGMILAHRIAQYFTEKDFIEKPAIIEIGANAGDLAKDILDTLESTFPTIYAHIQYWICEPLVQMQKIQMKTLAQHTTKVIYKETLNKIKSPIPNAILLSNELIDAFPVKLIQKTAGVWQELKVGLKNDTFSFVPAPIESPSLETFVSTLPDLPDDYITEYRPGIDAFAHNCASVIANGLVITIDYGHVKSAYYIAERSRGTLQTFKKHQVHDKPLCNAGKQDITAHVDFSQLGASFLTNGLTPTYFNTQARFLTHHGSTWLKTLENEPSLPTQLIRQFQTLTHPSMMGRQFCVLECETDATPDTAITQLLEIE